jgi:hypothetical protein
MCRAVSHNHKVPKLHQLADQFEDLLQKAIFESTFFYRFGYGAIHFPNSI